MADDKSRQAWQHNAPALYDVLVTHSLLWPTLTLRWLHSSRLLLGTFTSASEQEHLLVLRVRVPASTEAAEKHDWSQESDSTLFEREARKRHTGEVNRARAMPQDERVVATQGPIGDGSKGHTTVYNLASGSETVLAGLTADGNALCWSPHERGCLASGDNSGNLAIWDTSAATGEGQEGVAPRMKGVATADASTVEDVQFHPSARAALVSVGDDGAVRVWDTRAPLVKAALAVEEAHGLDAEVNGVSWSPHNDAVLASAGSDGTARVWDLRALERPVRVLGRKCHTEQLLQAEWAPLTAGVLATASTDGVVALWDATQERDADALVFRHVGHRAPVTEFCWSPEQPWTLASASEDNELHVWRVAAPLVW